MRQVSLECYQLLQLTLRLLPPYCLVCFCCVLLSLRMHVGFSETTISNLAQLLYVTHISADKVAVNRLLLLVALVTICILLGLGCLLMLLILLQFAGLSKPEFLFKFYPAYRSHKLKRKKAKSDTAKYIYRVGCVSFVGSLLFALTLCISTRREISSEITKAVAKSITSAMLQYKLNPWQGFNNSQQLDQIQSLFKCCGLNSYQDYLLEPRPVSITWEQFFYEKSLEDGARAAAWKYPMSCCLTSEIGQQRNCSKEAELHRFGCQARVLQFLHWQQAAAEYWSFSTGICIAAFGSMAYWAQAM